MLDLTEMIIGSKKTKRKATCTVLTNHLQINPSLFDNDRKQFSVQGHHVEQKNLQQIDIGTTDNNDETSQPDIFPKRSSCLQLDTPDCCRITAVSMVTNYGFNNSVNHCRISKTGGSNILRGQTPYSILRCV